jgi:hypothetical protein
MDIGHEVPSTNHYAMGNEQWMPVVRRCVRSGLYTRGVLCSVRMMRKAEVYGRAIRVTGSLMSCELWLRMACP